MVPSTLPDRCLLAAEPEHRVGVCHGEDKRLQQIVRTKSRLGGHVSDQCGARPPELAEGWAKPCRHWPQGGQALQMTLPFKYRRLGL